jgi:hypothetical protein
MKHSWLPKHCASLKKLDAGDEVQKKKVIVSVNFSHALFFLLSKRDNLVMQALVWLCTFCSESSVLALSSLVLNMAI